MHRLDYYKYTIIFLSLVLFMPGCRTAGVQKEALQTVKQSDLTGTSFGTDAHGGKGCAFCHAADENLLKGVIKGEVRGEEALSASRRMKSDLVTTCRTCHRDEGDDHVVGVAPKMNRHDLPLDDEGKMNCATTCHNVHPPDESDEKVKRGLLRISPDKLCFSCHDV